MSSSLAFSDSESTGAESTSSTATAEGEEQSGRSSYDEVWLVQMIESLDLWMSLATPTIYNKWKAFCNMSLMYYRSSRDLQAELEKEEMEVHALRQAFTRMTAEQESMQAMLEQTEAARARAQGTLDAVNSMVHEHMEKWEMVEGESEESE